MEELRRSLDQSRLRCLILEADNHAEKERMSRYRTIFAEMMDRMGEGDIRADPPETRSSGLHIVPWDGSALSTSPAVRHIYPVVSS